MQEVAAPETDLERLSAVLRAAGRVRFDPDADRQLLRTVEELLDCVGVVLRTVEVPQALEESADHVLVQAGGPHGQASLTLSLRRPPERPFRERERILVDLLRPRLISWLAAARVVPPAPAASLTPRQIEILRLAQLGMANKEIAHGLRISAGTVRKHLEHAYERLGANSRTGAVDAAFGSAPHPREVNENVG